MSRNQYHGIVSVSRPLASAWLKRPVLPPLLGKLHHHPYRLNMQRFFRSWLGFVVLAPAACGSPAELDESRFPSPNEVGYTDGNPINRSGGGGVANGGASNVGTGGAPSVPRAGSGGSGGVNQAQGGTGSVSTGGTNASGSTGGNPAAGGTGVIGGAGSGGVQPPAGSCPDDITVLFARPGAQGGCTQGGGCHEASSPIKPDLVSPNIEVRLVDVISSCKGRPYIGANDSFLADKIVGSPPECNGAMPFLSPQTLNAADEQCILDWIDEVSGG